MDNNSVAETSSATEVKLKTHFTGTVVKIGLAGAVVDLGNGQPAAIHVSQITTPENLPIKRVEDVLQLGQKIDVWVLRVKEGRVELTMIKPLDLEWRELKEGMTVKGKIVRLESFGAFVEIGAERPGLVHISEMSHDYVRTPGDVVKEGDEIEAQVLEINRKKKQIKLSIKALIEVPVIEEPEKPVELPPSMEGVNEEKRERMERFARSERPDRPARRRKGSRKDDDYSDAQEIMSGMKEPVDETDTSLGVALREAMAKDKANSKQSDKSKKGKNVSREQDDLLLRTLEHRAPTA